MKSKLNRIELMTRPGMEYRRQCPCGSVHLCAYGYPLAILFGAGFYHTGVACQNPIIPEYVVSPTEEGQATIVKKQQA